jgi:phage shock protein C
MKLRRSNTDKVIAGICGGLAECFEISSRHIRIALVLAVLFGGIDIILYLLAWIFIPKNED